MLVLRLQQYVHYVLVQVTQYRLTLFCQRQNDFQIELIHDQLPLAVPCYDLLPVTEFTLVLD